MSTSKVVVLHEFIADDGEWKRGEANLPADEARRREAAGYVDVISTDGAPAVWSPCCSDH